MWVPYLSPKLLPEESKADVRQVGFAVTPSPTSHPYHGV